MEDDLHDIHRCGSAVYLLGNAASPSVTNVWYLESTTDNAASSLLPTATSPSSSSSPTATSSIEDGAGGGGGKRKRKLEWQPIAAFPLRQGVITAVYDDALYVAGNDHRLHWS
jgi:hypothetical protein